MLKFSKFSQLLMYKPFGAGKRGEKERAPCIN